MPASQAIAKAKVGAEQAWQGKVKAKPPTFGAATATANIASKGLAGAVADYQSRSRTYDQQAIVKATAPVPTTPTGSPMLTAKPSWQESIKPNASAVSTTAGRPPKTGGLEGLMASIGKTRQENAALLTKKPISAMASNP